MMEALNPVGLDMARRLLAAMAVPAEAIEGYGKGAIVGAGGELEHGALWHVPGGYAMRELLGRMPRPTGEVSGQSGNALAIVPHQEGRRPGTTLDVPLTHINASYVRSHFDAIEVGVPGASARRRARLHPGDEHRRAGACAGRRPGGGSDRQGPRRR
jgi:hypothetical protein